MAIFPRAGKPAQQQDVYNIPKLLSNYYLLTPDVEQFEQRVQFGTSGHRGCADNASFNETHILAIVQAVIEYRQSQGINGPLFFG